MLYGVMDELQTDLVSNDVVKNSKEEKNLKKDSIQFASMLLLQDLYLLLKIYLNVIITWHIFFDGLIYAIILEHFNLMLE